MKLIKTRSYYLYYAIIESRLIRINGEPFLNPWKIDNNLSRKDIRKIKSKLKLVNRKL